MPDETPVQQDETVLSNPPAQPSAEEIAKRNSENAVRRIERKNWRQELETQNVDLSSDPDMDAVMELAKKEGYDLSDANLNQLRFIAKATGLLVTRGNQKLTAARASTLGNAARENLGETLQVLGFKPGDPKYRIFGNYIFGKIGTGNPDELLNQDRVKAEIENCRKEISGEPSGGDPVQEAILRRSGAPQPSREEQASGRDARSNEIKENAKAMGVSESAAKRISDLQKNLKGPWKK